MPPGRLPGGGVLGTSHQEKKMDGQNWYTRTMPHKMVDCESLMELSKTESE